MIERVETWVEHPVLGDLHVDTSYSNYQDFGGVKVPTRIVQKRSGQTFDATVTNASANPPTSPNCSSRRRRRPPGGAPAAAPPAPALQSEKLAEGVYRITGGYVGLAVEFKDHIVVLEGGRTKRAVWP
jgi:hypothetical protein